MRSVAVAVLSAPSRASGCNSTVRGTINGTMQLREDIRPVTSLKAGAAKLLRTVGETRRPVVITQSGVPRGVLLDYETYAELREATLLLKLIAGGEADSRAGRTIRQNEVFAEARERIARR